jgi:hypothetical protein
MAVHFTTRLLAVRTSSGKIRIQFGHLEDECEQLLVITGPDVIVPPQLEMTDEQFDRWQFDLTSGTGFGLYFGETSVDAPLVEAQKTLEDIIPKGAVIADLFWARVNSDRSIGVRIVNTWHQPIPAFSLSVDYKYETPQPSRIGDTPSRHAGGATYFAQKSANDGMLRPNTPTEYYLHPAPFRALQSYAASLSPENFWIALRTAEREFDRVPGNVVAEFIEHATSQGGEE